MLHSLQSNFYLIKFLTFLLACIGLKTDSYHLTTAHSWVPQQPESKTDLRCACLCLVYVPRPAGEMEQAPDFHLLEAVETMWETQFNTILHLAP